MCLIVATYRSCVTLCVGSFMVGDYGSVVCCPTTPSVRLSPSVRGLVSQCCYRVVGGRRPDSRALVLGKR